MSISSDLLSATVGDMSRNTNKWLDEGGVERGGCNVRHATAKALLCWEQVYNAVSVTIQK